jgi:hypothetical protein
LDWNPAIGEKYFYQIEHTVPGASNGSPLQAARVGPATPSVSIGDCTKTSTSTVLGISDGKNLADTPNWGTINASGVTAMSGGSLVYSPIAILAFDGSVAGNIKTVGVDGDNIFDESQDLVKDQDGVSQGLPRALNAAGYSYIKTAVINSSMSNQKSFSGNYYRLGMLEYCDAVVTDHGHNDAAFLTISDSQIKSLLYYHGTALRSAMKSGGSKRLVRSTLLPTNTFNTGTAQSGTTNTITLAASSSSVDGFYVNSPIKITGGTGSGKEGIITAYVGATKTATVNVSWTIAPDNTSTYSLLALSSGWTASDGIWSIYDKYLRRTGDYNGVPFVTASGDPDYVIDNYAAHGCNNLYWASINDTADGINPLSASAIKAQTYFNLLTLSTALGFTATNNPIVLQTLKFNDAKSSQYIGQVI